MSHGRPAFAQELIHKFVLIQSSSTLRYKIDLMHIRVVVDDSNRVANLHAATTLQLHTFVRVGGFGRRRWRRAALPQQPRTTP